MPDSTGSGSPWLGAAIGGGSSLLGDIFNLFGQSKANKEQEQYNLNVMNQQRQWSLQDVAAQNAYNSPVQQMQRLKEAGLNPNLIYGEGITASGQSDQPRSVPAPSYSPQNTLAGFSNLGAQASSAIQQFQDIQKTTASVHQMEQSTANMKLQGVMQDMLNEVQKASPETAGFRYTAPDGTKKYMSPTDFLSTLGDYKMETAKSNRDIAAAAADAGVTKANMDYLQLQIAKATKESTITAALQAGKQAILNLGLTEAQKKNVEASFQGILNSQSLQQMEIKYKNENFHNNPIMQQLFHGAILAALALL